MPMYFASLAYFGHNILHTVTIATAPQLDLSVFAFYRDAHFRVLAKRTTALGAAAREHEALYRRHLVSARRGRATPRAAPARDR